MKTTITRNNFIDAFYDSQYKNNFSFEGLHVLYDYFEELESSTGEEIELDVVAIACEYEEESIQELLDYYTAAYDLESIANKHDLLEYLGG